MRVASLAVFGRSSGTCCWGISWDLVGQLSMWKHVPGGLVGCGIVRHVPHRLLKSCAEVIKQKCEICSRSMGQPVGKAMCKFDHGPQTLDSEPHGPCILPFVLWNPCATSFNLRLFTLKNTTDHGGGDGKASA